MTGLDPIYVETVVRNALAEDIGSGDITTLITVPEDREAVGTLIAKQDGVIAGQEIARSVFRELVPETIYDMAARDGARVKAGDVIATVTGNARAILTGERTALNFLQRMSGIATVTARYVDLVSHTKAKIIDTRKTTPGLRRLEKYAVTVGGGFNHRFGLSDGILIKDNHIAAAGGIMAAVNAAKARAPHTLKIEVEVTSLDELDEAIAAGADAVLLDNMTSDVMRRAVEAASERVLIEASGGITEANVCKVAATGVDLISVGALTHSPRALDISLRFA